MTDHIRYGNTYNFDLDPPLDAEFTEMVINQLLFHLRGVPENEIYTFDLRFGSDNDDDSDWSQYVEKSRDFQRAVFKREGKITRSIVIDFLREHFADMLTLPHGLRVVK